MSRKGSLSVKTYFPNSGDQLENHREGIVWECGRSNNYDNKPTNEKFKYGLLIGRSSEIDDPVLWAIHDRDQSPWLDHIDIIHRRVGTSKKTYYYNESTKTWQE